MLKCRDCEELAELCEGHIVCPRCDARVEFSQEYIEAIVRNEVNMEIKRLTIRGLKTKDFEHGIFSYYILEEEPDTPQFIYR